MIEAAFVVGGVAVGFAIAWWWPFPIRTQTCMYFCKGTRLQSACVEGVTAATKCLSELRSQCGTDEPIS